MTDLRQDITPLILTRDEEANIGRTLEQLRWARQVIVVDSRSTDRTAEIVRSFPNTILLERTFDTLAGQSNFGIAQASTEWVMLLDADYFVPDELACELAELDVTESTSAFRGRFVYAVRGRRLRASLYPPRVVLLRKGRATVWQDGHAHRVKVDGLTAELRSVIVHDDRKSFRRFIARQRVYMRQEAIKIRTTPWRALNWVGRVRRLIVIAPLAALVHTLFIKGVLIDGRAGWEYAFERFVAEAILSLELLFPSNSTTNRLIGRSDRS
jgi:glycosyltransferase involved in cell wall biosynthesis